jgi:hypothetical protein
MKKHDPRQLSLFARRPETPTKLSEPSLTVEDCRRILHTAQVMQMNTARPARELHALGRLEVWMRGIIRERVSIGRPQLAAA